MTSYSQMEHLACASFISHYNEDDVMAMLAAYFDASGHPDSTHVLTVAGFASTTKKWIKFEKEWNKVLAEYKVPYLHMKKFCDSQGPFEDWRNNEERRKNFIIALIRVMKWNTHKSFGCSVIVEDFMEVNKSYKLDEKWGMPYSLCGVGVVSRVRDWKNKRFPNSHIKHFFEAGDKHVGHLTRCLDQMKIPYAITPKKEMQNGIEIYTVPYQAADFAAWENRNALTKTIGDPLTDLRKSFQELYKQIPSKWTIFPKDKLVLMCEHYQLRR